MLIIDAKNLIVGRFATIVAKKALLGESISVINCEKAVISGTKKKVISDWKRKHSMGVPRKGPFIQRHPDKFVRRMIRGMLPYKKPRGSEAFKKIICYIGTPNIKGEKLEIKGAHVDKLSNKYVTIGTICKYLGGISGETNNGEIDGQK